MKSLLWISLAAIASPLCAAFGPERPVTPATLGNVPTLQTAPAVTGGSDEFFVVWTDHRGGTPDALATRIDTRGNVSNPSGIVLGRNVVASSAVAPSRNYLVALTENCERVYSVTVDSLTGAVGPRRLIGTMSRCGTVELVTNGETVLAIMDAGGALLDPNGVPVFESFGLPQETAGGASNGREYAVVATPKVSADGRDVVVVDVSRRGEVGSEKVLEQNAAVSGAAIAGTGSSYLVVWTTDEAVKAAEVSGDFSTAGTVRTVATGTNFRSPRLTWTGGDYRLAFIDGGAGSILKMMRVTQDGTVIDTPVEYSGPGQVASPALAALPHFRGIAVWPSHGEGLVAGLFEPGISVDRPYLSTHLLTAAAIEQGNVSAGSTGSHAVIAWTEGRSLLARRTDGLATGSDVVLVATLSAATMRRADVEFDGTAVWISWRDENVLYTRRFNADLTPRDFAPVRIAERAEHFDSAGGSGRVLFTWTGEPFIFSAVMTASDAGTGPQSAIVSQEPFTGAAVAATWTGSSFLVGWARRVGPEVQELRTARVSPGGGVLDSASRLIASNVNPIGALHLASTGQDAVAVWQRDGDVAISFRALNLDGSPVAGESIVPGEAPARKLEKTLAYRNQYYVATSSIPSLLRVRYTVRSLFGATDPVAEGDAVESARSMAIAQAGNAMLAAYVRRADGNESGGVNRLFMRVSEDLTGPARRRVARH